jgi:two-component system, NtrC family, response regulator HydG
MAKILIVEDQFVEANNLQLILERAGYEVCTIAHSVSKAQQIIKNEKPDMILLDIRLQGTLTGIDLAHSLKDSDIVHIYLSANSDKKTLEQARATKPFGFLVKPFREKDVLVSLDVAWYLHEEARKQHKIKSDHVKPLPGPGDAQIFANIVGNSKALTEILDNVRLVGPSDTSVLILGETGTGKELIAKSIHRASLRASKPFVVINCAALPSELIESELFGHEKGSFTGAFERKIGKFEQANNGTVFLDEIGELPRHLQIKFLRVLQEREIERIGGKPVKVNVRVIAATNRDLHEEVAAGRFRLDLYYRLNVYPLTLPPLRERKEDLEMLAGNFIRKFASETGRNVTGLSKQAVEEMKSYDWPGNIRELENLIERSVLQAKFPLIETLPILQDHKKDIQVEESGRRKTIEENERDHISAVIKECNGKIFGKGGAAEVLNISVSSLNARIKKLGIDKRSL